MIWLWLVLILLLCGLLYYWLVIITEGVYVGQWLVTLLYDRVANDYDDIKEYGPTDEYYFLGVPLSQALGINFSGICLDVAAGTGRVAAAMAQFPEFKGKIIGTDHSFKMLLVSRQKMPNVPLVQADALYLPFAAEAVEAVTCLEALEFLPNLAGGLGEMARILEPNGVLLTSNRVGLESFLMPGKALPEKELARILAGIPLEQVSIRIWETVDSFNIKAEKDGELEAYIQTQMPQVFWKRLMLELTTSRYQKVWARKPKDKKGARNLS